MEKLLMRFSLLFFVLIFLQACSTASLRADLCNLGDSVACNNLGFMYEKGEGVPQNYSRAFDFYVRSATQGCVQAQHNLGFLYENGRGVAKNSERALEWYKKAAAQGHAGSQNNIGVIYQNRNQLDLAFSFYQKACDAGSSFGCLNLAAMYISHKRGTRERAISAANFACNKGHKNACDTLLPQLNTGTARNISTVKSKIPQGNKTQQSEDRYREDQDFMKRAIKGAINYRVERE